MPTNLTPRHLLDGLVRRDVLYLQQGQAMFAQFRSAFGRASPSRLAILARFVNQVFVWYFDGSAAALRRLADNRKGTASFYRLLIAEGRKESAAELLRLAEPTVRYVNNSVAHLSTAVPHPPLPLAAHEKAVRCVITLYLSEYEAIVGVPADQFEAPDPSWIEALTEGW